MRNRPDRAWAADGLWLSSRPAMAVRVRWVCWVVWAMAMLPLGGCWAPPRVGPLPLRSQHPVQLTALRLEAEAVSVPTPGAVELRADATYSSMFLSGSSAGGANRFVMDGEYLRARLGVRVGLPGDLQVGLDLPVAHTTGGVLDPFVIRWHDWFGLPDQNRDVAPRDRFRVEAVHQGAIAYRLDEEDLRLMDVPVVLKWNALPATEGGLGLALRCGVEVPTGDQDRGIGNGGVDYAFGALAEWRPAGFTLHAHAGHSLVATPDRARQAGLSYADIGAAGLGVAVPLWQGWEGLAQVEWESSTLRRLGFDRAARDQILLWLGGRARLARGLHVEFAVGEDLSGFVAPDFSVFAGVSWVPTGADR